MQKAGLEDDLLTTSAETFQEFLRETDHAMVALRRNFGVTERTILSKKQLIEANKAQFTRVGTSWPLLMHNVVHAPAELLWALTHSECHALDMSFASCTSHCFSDYMRPAHMSTVLPHMQAPHLPLSMRWSKPMAIP